MNCTTCGKYAQTPYRRMNKEGKIIEGCIDKIHDEYLAKSSNSWYWVSDNRKKNKTYCKEQCPYKPRNKKDYHCKLCNLV